MPIGVQTQARAASNDDGVVFDPALCELDPTGNVLRKVAAAGEEGSAGTVASRADLVALLQAAAAAAEIRETVTALESLVHSDEIATHGLNATLSGKDKEIARLKALRRADVEGGGGAGGAREEAVAEVNELKRKLRDKEASEARLMASSRDRLHEDSHAQSQIDQLIGMVWTLAARQQTGPVQIASSTATAPPVGVSSRSVGNGVDYSEYAGMMAGETHEIFEATMSAEAVKKRGDAQFATAYSAWRRLLRMYPVSERVQHQLIGYAFSRTAKASFLKISSQPKHDATTEALWKVMAKELYNDTMVRSQRGAFTSPKLDSVETVDDLSDRLQNLFIDLPELEGAAGDAVLLQHFTDALPEEL
jgi:hypothetical protein